MQNVGGYGIEKRRGRRRLDTRTKQLSRYSTLVGRDVNVKVEIFWTVSSSLTVRLPGHAGWAPIWAVRLPWQRLFMIVSTMDTNNQLSEHLWYIDSRNHWSARVASASRMEIPWFRNASVVLMYPQAAYLEPSLSWISASLSVIVSPVWLCTLDHLMNQQQQNPNANPSTNVGGTFVHPREDMEYLCAGERSILWLFPCLNPTQSKIAVPKMRSNPVNPFVVENVVIV